MVMAVVILLLPVVLIYWWFSRIPEPQVTAVDWQPVVAAAKAESPYAIAVPASVPDGWTVVRARWTKVGQPGLNQQPAVGNTLQLGYLTTDRMYLGLDQRDTDSRGLIREVSKDAVSDGESVIADVVAIEPTASIVVKSTVPKRSGGSAAADRSSFWGHCVPVSRRACARA